MNKFICFIRDYWLQLLCLLFALIAFSATIQGPLNTHLTYMSARESGDFLGMGEMRINENCERKDDTSILLKEGGTLFGPYFDFQAGTYQFIVNCTSPSQSELPAIAITAEGGVQQLGIFPLFEGENNFKVELNTDQNRVEFVLRNENVQQGILVTKLSFTPVTSVEKF